MTRPKKQRGEKGLILADVTTYFDNFYSVIIGSLHWAFIIGFSLAFTVFQFVSHTTLIPHLKRKLIPIAKLQFKLLYTFRIQKPVRAIPSSIESMGINNEKLCLLILELQQPGLY